MSAIEWHPNPESEEVVQSIKFINPPNISNGDSLSVQFPLTDSNGEVLRGEFLAEVTPDNVVKIIGRG